MGDINFLGDPLLVNNGQFIDSIIIGHSMLDNGNPLFINEGTFIKKTGSTTTIQIPFENNAIIEGEGNLNITTDSVAGSGVFNPGFSPGLLTIDGSTSLRSGIEIEIENENGPGVGHDQVEVNGIDINAGYFRLSGMLNISDGRYRVVKCVAGDSCYTGTFNVAYLPSDYRLNYLTDVIEVVKGSGCLSTWKVDYLYLSNDPHVSDFQASDKIISNGIITSGEQIVFDASNGVELIIVFEVQSGAELDVQLVGCIAPPN
jgi:hypothetical protein